MKTNRYLEVVIKSLIRSTGVFVFKFHIIISISVSFLPLCLRSWRDVLNTTLCDKVCQLLATDQWFSAGTLVSFTNKTDRHDITEIVLNVALNTITITL